MILQSTRNVRRRRAKHSLSSDPYAFSKLPMHSLTAATSFNSRVIFPLSSFSAFHATVDFPKIFEAMKRCWVSCEKFFDSGSGA
ncbi:hypothetical protein DM02DRAFT_344284 [Periconia macrospinosa]|uniref:Uncharacterized protein n=1 Tax=Periconia macrospinosa TaxID=97972 RepID=A0A2V1D177_9PLEO|nr:hypothetical protein DM02DRAFT_344284 [Periconia macrospinosa]